MGHASGEREGRETSVKVGENERGERTPDDDASVAGGGGANKESEREE